MSMRAAAFMTNLGLILVIIGLIGILMTMGCRDKRHHIFEQPVIDRMIHGK